VHSCRSERRLRGWLVDLALFGCMSEMDQGTDGPPLSLEELTVIGRQTPSWRVDLMLRDGGCGKFSEADLDAIALRPDATALRVSGLDQSTFEAFVARYGRQFTALHFLGCPLIHDFSPLEGLPDLILVSINWNQRTTRLWDLSKTPNLNGLGFESFTRLRDLGDLTNAVAIEEVIFGDQLWGKSTVASLEPIAKVTTLRRLGFVVGKVEDGRIQPLADLPLLERFDCSSNLFTTEQLAWLRAHLPDSVEGRVLAPFEKFDQPLPNPNGHGPDRDVLVMGKRKPFLNSHADAARLQRYVDEYWKLVERFRNDPSLEPASA
jgi:hypothetical protein